MLVVVYLRRRHQGGRGWYPNVVRLDHVRASTEIDAYPRAGVGGVDFADERVRYEGVHLASEGQNIHHCRDESRSELVGGDGGSEGARSVVEDITRVCGCLRPEDRWSRAVAHVVSEVAHDLVDLGLADVVQRPDVGGDGLRVDRLLVE